MPSASIGNQNSFPIRVKEQGAENIIPNTVLLRGTIRNQDLATREFVFKRIEEVVKYITKAMRADYKVDYLFGYPPTKNDSEIVDRFLAD